MSAIVSATIQAAPQFYDIDPMNIVWHGHYPRFLEIARCAVLDKIQYSYSDMLSSGYAWPIVDMQLRYAHPLVLGQTIEVTAGIVEWESRLRITYVFRDAGTGQRTTRGHTIQVAVDTKKGEMLWETPPILREKLAPFLPR
jgi:acyl-CoA thioester hydrolase